MQGEWARFSDGPLRDESRFQKTFDRLRTIKRLPCGGEPDPRDWTEREILNVISIRCKELEDYVETNRICKHKVLSAGAKKMMSGLMAKLGKIIEYCDASSSLNGDETKEK